jgi:hypothetical protein
MAADLYRSLVEDLLEEQESGLERLNALEVKCAVLLARLQEARDRVLALENERELLLAELRDVKAARAAERERGRKAEEASGVAMAG